jgi:flavin reductase (DIM6/NTAB) family NADH-FMN oxidoreductase RutF
VNVAREFVVNVPRAEQLEEVDLAGVWSGAEHDKFEELGLTARPASLVNAPLIEECPINIECVVRHQLALGAHDLYIAEIVAVQYDEDVLDAQGRVQTKKLTPIAYVEGEYWSLGERIGSYGAAAKASGRR